MDSAKLIRKHWQQSGVTTEVSSTCNLGKKASQHSIVRSKSRHDLLLLSNHGESTSSSRPKNRLLLALYPLQSNISAVIVVLLSLAISFNQITLVAGSPPIDYFVYTSQQQQQNQAQKDESVSASKLAAIESIYSPTAGSTGGGVAPLSINDTHHLNELAARVLALVRNSSHTHDNDLIDLETTRYAWHLMERQASLYMKQRVNTMKGLVQQLLLESQVSNGCQEAITSWLVDLADLKQWAMLMWNSWGEFPPAGIYEGSFTDLGSYRGCIGVEDNDIIGQSQYCMLDFQPLVPSRPRFHSIFKKILSVDKHSNRLVGGDYKDVERIGSRHTSHGTPSERFSVKEPRSGHDDGVSSQPKYNKRTIVHDVLKNSTSLNQTSENSNSNLTLKAEALIELANKAQYFYYVRFRIGACLPSKCSQDDVGKLAQVAGQRAILQTNQVNCMKKEPVSLNTHQKVAIWILSTLALVAVIGTVVDLLGFKADKNSNTLANWLLAFSIWTNGKRLFDYETAGTHGDLECVHGLRFFSMIWVVYGHTILYTEYQSFTHFYDVIEKQIPSFILLPSLNANFSVDTFFVISGILTTYVAWEYTKGDPRKFNKFAFLISRYIRLTPQLAIVILCFFLLPLFGDGPLYKQVTESQANVCFKNWGINLLYLQSYINAEKLCIDPSWWLSIEMTFHFVSMIVIVVLIQNPAKGMVVNVIIATILTLWGAIIHYSNGFAIQYLPSIPQRYEISQEQTRLFFHRPYPHAASYFIGIALGYVLANRTIKKLSKSQVLQGWTVCAFGLSISLWGSYYWNLGAPYTQLQATIYYNLCQILWPTSIAWIILACSLGHGGIVNSILSAKYFVPLGRITYMTYLSHALIIYYHSASTNIPVEPSMMLFFYLFVANTFLSLALGVILTVVYESPILNLQKVLFTYLTQKFDPTIQHNMTPLPTTIVCDKNGVAAAGALLLPKETSNGFNGIIHPNGINGHNIEKP